MKHEETHHIVATRNGETETEWINCSDDTDATFHAISMIMIMNLGTESDLWGKGRIELIRLSDGCVLEVMEEI